MKETNESSETKEAEASKYPSFGPKLINRLTMQDLQLIQNAFHIQDGEEEGQLCVNKEQFCKLLGVVLNKGTVEEYADLFEKVDINREGLVDWDQLCSHILLECYEKDDRIKITKVPQWRELKLLYSPHKDVILKVAYFSNTSKYCTVSKDGNICFWNTDLKLIRNARVQTDPEEVRPRDLWVTSFAPMVNVYKLAVALTSKEILIYDLSAKSEFNRQYRIYNLSATPICLDYWYNTDNPRQAYLSFGDTSGCVHVIAFANATHSLFERPAQPAGGSHDVCLSLSINNISKGVDKHVSYYKHNGHSEWARQVSYSSFLDSFISSSTTSKDSLVLASIDKSRIQMRHNAFRISQGINGFDYNENNNIIATAGINNHVCLWNPYVISKPIGVLRGHMQSVLLVKFIHSRRQLISLSKDKVLRVWDTHLQVCLQRLSGIFPKGIDMNVTMFFDQERSRLFTTFNQQLTLMVMKAEVKDRIMSHENPISSVIYNSKLNQVVSVCSGSVMTMWLLDSGQKLKQFSNAHGKSEITCLAQDVSETKLITGSNDGTLKIWDFDGHCYHVLIASDGNPCEIGNVLWLKQNVIAVGWEKVICTFMTQNFKSYYVYPSEWRGKHQHQDDILSVGFSPPHTLATGSYDGDIVLWNTTTENAFKQFSCPTQPTTEKYSTRKSSTALSTSFGVVHSRLGSRKSLRGTDDEEKREPYKKSSRASGNTSSASSDPSNEDPSCAIITLLYLEARPTPSASSSAANLVSVSGNGEVHFWNTLSGTIAASFVPHQHSGLIKIATDKENALLVSGDGDGTCKIWKISEYCIDSSIHNHLAPPLMNEFTPHTDSISSLQIVERLGKTLILTGSSDCSVALHRLSGKLVGIFGQEEHWSLDSLLTEEQASAHGSTENLNDESKYARNDVKEEERSTTRKSRSVDRNLDVDVDGHYHTWEKTILGVAYKEKNQEKRERRQPFSLPSIPSEKGVAMRTFKSLSCTELDSIGSLRKPDFVHHPERYFSEKPETNERDSVPMLPPILDKLIHRHDMKSIFPKYILEMDLKMRTAHALAMGSSASSGAATSAVSTPLTLSPILKSARAKNDQGTDRRDFRLNRELLRKAISFKKARENTE